MITSRIQQSLYSTILHIVSVEQYSNQLQISADIIKNTVHWPSMYKERKEARMTQTIFITKGISDDTGTGSVMNLTKQRLHSNCPRYNSEHEDTTHAIQCKTVSICNLRNNILSKLKVWLNYQDTHLDIFICICSGLGSWLSGSNITYELNEYMEPKTKTSLRT